MTTKKATKSTANVTEGKDPALAADREQVEKFVDVLFRYADRDSYVSLRVFDDTKDARPLAIESVLAKDTFNLIQRACRLIERAAAVKVPHVFCPPIATFKAPKKADAENLVNGLTLSVECDQRAEAARVTLTALLGPPTVVVASGGEWINPETNSPEPKLHIHWRLKQPTRTPTEHNQLRLARDRATTLVGGDSTNKSIVHPMRWPGSWHRKKEPRLTRIVELNPDAEIDLMEALRVLPWRERETVHHPGGDQQASPERIAAAMAVIPNNDREWGDWKNIGMAIWAATGGSEEGRAIFHDFSKKSKKYNDVKTDAAWEAIHRSPPTSIGAGTIFHLANEASPGWEEKALAAIEAEINAANKALLNLIAPTLKKD